MEKAPTTAPHAPDNYLAVRPDWLARRSEPALEPELPIVDAHHHLWDRPGWRYLLEELLADIRESGHNIAATVFMQCFEKAADPPTSETLAAAWRPYVETCIDAFGVERCMFESNFPVDKGSYSYGAGWNAFKRLTQGASAAEKTALFSATATHFYRLADGV